MSSSESVQVDPDLLKQLAIHPANGAGSTGTATDALVTYLNNLMEALTLLSNVAYIGQAAQELHQTLNDVTQSLVFSMGCYGTNLRILGTALANTACRFTDTDADLTKLLEDLDGHLREYENFATS